MGKIGCGRVLSSFSSAGLLTLSAAGPLQAATPHRDVAPDQEKRPNIIFILTDDHRYDALGVMGNPIIRTPNLDALARDGVLYTNAYVTTSISCSSRASILTGQYVSRHGVCDFVTDIAPDRFAETYPVLLREAGYKTGFVGKFGIGLPNQPKDQFDYWACEPKHQPDYENKDRYGTYYHHTDGVSREIAGFLDNFAGKEEPFCLSVSFKAPHTQDGDPREFITHPRYDAYYADVEIPEPAVGSDEYWNLFPEFFREPSEARNRWRSRFETPEKYQHNVKNYYRLITQVDDVIGDMLHQLERLGIDDNTVIIFMGDNGMFLGEHGLAGKWFIYEESVRVPMFIYDPRAPRSQRGIRESHMALNIDIAPTILALAGISAPEGMQGRNLSALQDKEARESWRHDFYYEHRLPHPAIPQSEGVVSPDYKYVVYFTQQPAYEELYDMRRDPHEVHNLVSDPAYADVLAAYRTRCEELKREAR